VGFEEAVDVEPVEGWTGFEDLGGGIIGEVLEGCECNEDAPVNVRCSFDL